MGVFGVLSPIRQVATAMVQPCIVTEETVRPVLFQVVQLDIRQQILGVRQLKFPALENTAMAEPVGLAIEHAISIATRSLTMPMADPVHQPVEQYVEEVLRLHLLVLERITILQGSLKQQELAHLTRLPDTAVESIQPLLYKRTGL
jgi:hypothetical protein